MSDYAGSCGETPPRRLDEWEIYVVEYTVLHKAGLTYRDELLALTQAEVMRIPGMGPKRMQHLLEVLANYGVTLRPA